MGRTNRVLMLLLLLGLVTVMLTSIASAQGDEKAQTTEKVDYFDHYFVKGGWIVWFLELPMSVAMVALAVMFFIEFRRTNLLPDASLEQIRSLLEARQYREAIEYSAADPSMVSGVIHAALAEASNGYPAMERAMEEAIDDQTSKNLRKIEYLNIIGNIAPMVGLFGTVFGMIKTFQAIVVAKGIPEPDKLAEGISIALVTTLWGLAIAIPALTVFAALRNRIEGLAAETALRAQGLLGMFNPSASKTAGATAGATAPAAKPAAAPNPTPQPTR